MASILDMSASSDSEDDVDYVPNGAVSDCSIDEEEISDDEDCNAGQLNGKKAKKTKQAEDKEAETKSDSTAKVDEKQRANDLWASFLSDVESVTPKKSSSVVCNASVTNEAPKTDTKPVCKVFEFAGETVTVDKDLNSSDSLSQQAASEKNNSEAVTTEKPPLVPVKRGIDSVLGAIMNKNKKLTVLEKTSLDWKLFKKDEGLDKDLEKHNKGKQGFIERQRFLERSDLRSFEMEKSMRQTVRKK